jgi:hypothetical protein
MPPHPPLNSIILKENPPHISNDLPPNKNTNYYTQPKIPTSPHMLLNISKINTNTNHVPVPKRMHSNHQDLVKVLKTLVKYQTLTNII